MSKLVRAITEDGSAVAMVLDSAEIVNRIEKVHQTSAVVTAGLGRLATAAALMGSMLKGKNDSLTLRVKGDGHTGTLIAVSNSRGEVKAYVENPVVELPLNKQGKLDVASAVGRNGVLNVIKDMGLKEPYSGHVELVSGEIAEDIAYYYANSEQIPTVCALGVLVNPDLTVHSAGGLIVQLLPYANDKIVDNIEKNVKEMSSISELFAMGMTPRQICMKALEGLNPNMLDEVEARYKCDCSEERVTRAIKSLSKDELEDMIKSPETTEVRCHFCNKSYVFDKKKLQVIKSKKK